MEYMDFGSRNSFPFTTNCTRKEQVPTRSTRTKMDDQRKDYIDPSGSKQRNRSKQLQTHNLTTDYLENINSTNRNRDLLLVNKTRTAP